MVSPARPRQRKGWRKAAIAVVAAVATLAVLELVVRGVAPESDFFGAPDPVLGVALRPGARGRVHHPEYVTELRVNSLGFRGPERSPTPPAGTTRVLYLGDSFTEARQVAFDETFAARLEASWRAQGRAREAVAWGVSGYGTAQEWLLYRDRAYRLGADVVVLMFALVNDVEDNDPELRGHDRLPVFALGAGPDGLEPRPFEPPALFDSPLAALVRANHSHLLSKIARGLLRRGRAAETPGVAPEGAERALTPGEERARELTRRLLVAFAAEVRAHKARPALAILPDPSLLRGRDARRPWLLGVAKTLGLPALDLQSALASADSPARPVFFPINRHLTAHGHAVVAKALVDFPPTAARRGGRDG